ncbi:unnamed protein product [Schistocephalus solidus]|uniref:Nucleoporin p58/p45 n=1 Tax=Schistocephalus solidus TaxID=70667 RepID=A0A183TAI3_SCHSO|nr:unnamed protein product [Schistocephalus solidus]
MAEQKKIRDEFNNAPIKTLDTLKSELAELQSAVISVSSGSRKQSVQAAHLNEEALKAMKIQFLRQFRTTNGEKPLISLSDLENPLPQTSFDLLEKDFTKSSLGHTPYGPSPFSMSAVDSSAATAAVSVQPAVTSGAQGFLQTLTSAGNPNTLGGGLFSQGGTPGKSPATICFSHFWYVLS